MDLGKKLHMSLDDLIKTRNEVQKKDKASEKTGGKRVKTAKAKTKKQDSLAKLQTKPEPRKKVSAGKQRVDPATTRGGKRGQSTAGKRGLNSAVRVRFAPKVMAQSTQRQFVQDPPVKAPSLASFVNGLTLRSNKDAQVALKIARQLEAMAQEKLGFQQPAPSRTGNNGRNSQRAAIQEEELVQRSAGQRGTSRRAAQRGSPPIEPVNPLHDPSRYDHGWDEYVDHDMEEEDVKPSIAAMQQLRSRRGGR